jgi:HPt (histidine-containing phosphotransfer) domain-containing protein
MKQQYTSGDMAGLRETSHRLGGMAKHMGLSRLSELAGDIQQYAIKGDIEKVNLLIDEINPVFKRSLDSLDQFISSIKSPEK